MTYNVLSGRGTLSLYTTTQFACEEIEIVYTCSTLGLIFE